MEKIKLLLINHGEKILAVVCALFGFLAFSSAHWSADHRDPHELVDKSKESKDKIEQNIWPDEEKAIFGQIKDVRALTAVESQHKIDPSNYQTDVFNRTLHRSREKSSLVAVVAPAHPVADPIIVVLALPPEETEVEGEIGVEGGAAAAEPGKGETKEMTDEETLEALMQEKYGIKAPAAGGMSGPGSGGDAGYGEGPPEAEGYGDDNGGMGDYMGGSDLYGDYGGSSMMAEKTRIRVAAGVSVRLTVNVQEQRAVLRKALHLGAALEEAQSLILYTDLLVERRQMHADGNGWQEWEPLSSDDLGEVLKESFGIDRDVVNPGVTRNTITMPLPRRAAGVWTAALASHPDLENFVLSDEEKALIDKWNKMLLERIEEEQANAPIIAETKGFSSFVQSATDMGNIDMYGGGSNGYGGGSEGYEDEMITQYESGMQEGGGKLSAKDREILDATRATAENRLLLVRFMDFTVERGYTYQYRVRVEMKNPNYNKPLDALEDPALGAEPTLKSAWSEATPAAFVPEGHRMYVSDVDARSGRPESAKLTVFTDSTDTGMPMLGKVTVSAGMPIAGKVKQEVVDLTVKAVEEREVAVTTSAILASAEEMLRLSSSDHPELKSIIDQLERGKSLIPSQISVVDSDGAIRLRVIGDLRKQEEMDEAEAKFILDRYSEAWKKTSAGGEFFGPDGEAGGEGEGYGGDLGMSEGSSSVGGFFGGGGEAGKKLSSRAQSRAKRDAKKNGTMGPGMMGPGGMSGGSSSGPGS